MTHNLAHVLELLRDALIRGDDGIEGIADFAGDAGLMARQPHGEVAGLHGVQRVQQFMLIKLRCSRVAVTASFAQIFGARFGPWRASHCVPWRRHFAP